MEKYIIYPCNQAPSPGFLEHLPSMFKEVNVEGRCALRWAVLAAAYADVSRDQDGNAVACKALQCYGRALSALGESLSAPGKVPDDYDLMTVVVLDIFEVSVYDSRYFHDSFTLIHSSDIICTRRYQKRIPRTRNGSDTAFAGQ